jgi:prepilin-type N-terminal cleavage/methylation domain-containing protein
MEMTRRGFTLVEVMVSSVVFILILSGTMPLVMMSATAGRNAHDLSRANEAVNMVIDRVVGARQLKLALPGPGNVPADVTTAPVAGERCYFLRTTNRRVSPPRGCTELGDNALIARGDIADTYVIQWVTKRERALPGAPAIDNITVTASWKKGTGRLHQVTGVVRVAR